MAFSNNLSQAKKKAIYERSIANLEQHVFSLILEAGFDPDNFDSESFSPTFDNISQEFVRSHVLLRAALDSLNTVKDQYEERF
jgi:hypothetical protein